MTIRDNKYPIPRLVKPKNVLMSTFDKNGLEPLIEGILEVYPNSMIYSTGGTGEVVKEILGPRTESNYISVEDYTSEPEMKGGLVKTLTPAVHGGLLSEANNPAHELYLVENNAVAFDLLVGNLYPFADVVKQEGVTAETARGNIDIGGPAMIRAAAKNWPRVGVLVHPGQYESFIDQMKRNGGITPDMRFDLMKQAFALTAEYDKNITGYFAGTNFNDIESELNFEGDEE